MNKRAQADGRKGIYSTGTSVCRAGRAGGARSEDLRMLLTGGAPVVMVFGKGAIRGSPIRVPAIREKLACAMQAYR